MEAFARCLLIDESDITCSEDVLIYAMVYFGWNGENWTKEASVVLGRPSRALSDGNITAAHLALFFKQFSRCVIVGGRAPITALMVICKMSLVDSCAAHQVSSWGFMYGDRRLY